MKISKKIIIAIASFVILVLQAFGLKVDVPLVNEIVSAGAGILVMLGIISDTHTPTSGTNEKNDADGTAADETSENTSDESEGAEVGKNSDDNVGSEDNAGNTDGDTSDDEDIGA